MRPLHSHSVARRMELSHRQMRPEKQMRPENPGATRTQVAFWSSSRISSDGSVPSNSAVAFSGIG